jgi:hypothetical protein
LVPAELAAECIEAADEQAAGLVAARGEIVRHETRVDIEVAARCAEGPRIVDAGDIPDRVAAERIDRTDFVAACGVIAPWRLVRDDAAAEGKEATFGLAAGCAGTLKADRPDARLVPCDGTAELIDAADPIAALLVIAADAHVGREAVPGLGGTADALDRLAHICSEQGAVQIPLGLAAEWREAAHGLAAFRIVAEGRRMGSAAFPRHGRSARQGFAPQNGEIDAEVVPPELAADRVGVADETAACWVVAVRQDVGNEAVADGIAALEAHVSSDLHAVCIPAHANLATHRIDLADQLAAFQVVAGRQIPLDEAVSGSLTATGQADLLRHRGTRGVPTVGTTRWVGLTDRRAAGRIVARR